MMYHEPHIFVNDEPLKATDYFTYLGSTLSREANSKWKSITDSPKPTLHLEDSGRKCGTDEELAKRPS